MKRLPICEAWIFQLARTELLIGYWSVAQHPVGWSQRKKCLGLIFSKILSRLILRFLNFINDISAKLYSTVHIFSDRVSYSSIWLKTGIVNNIWKTERHIFARFAVFVGLLVYNDTVYAIIREHCEVSLFCIANCIACQSVSVSSCQPLVSYSFGLKYFNFKTKRV